MSSWREFLTDVANATKFERENKGETERIKNVWEYTMHPVDEQECGDSCNAREKKETK